jgi:amino-acid N-acetyltransferase
MNIIPDYVEYPIRAAQLEDVPGIYTLLKYYSDRGVLLPRPQSDIYTSLRDFYVADDGGKIIACAALLIYTRELGEVRSLAVDPAYMKIGLGNRIVDRIENDAGSLGLIKLMALTYVVEFFEKLNYKVVEMGELPEKVWGACINCHKFQNCDEIAVLKFIN